VNVQSWMIKSWTTVEWYLPETDATCARFRHVSTQLRDDGSGSGYRAGDTVWVSEPDEDGDEHPDGLETLSGRAGLAWEWVEVRPGVVMLADPNSVITNLQFVDKAQKKVTGLNKIVSANRLVHGLHWQDQVRRCLSAGALPPLRHAA
jgi:hypothetical protein